MQRFDNGTWQRYAIAQWVSFRRVTDENIVTTGPGYGIGVDVGELKVHERTNALPEVSLTLHIGEILLPFVRSSTPRGPTSSIYLA